MSVTGWSLVRFAHVLAAMGWVGGQLLLTGVVLPAVRAELSPQVRGPVVHRTARRFALLANPVLLPTLLVTGLLLAWHRGVTLASFENPGYGRLLGIKLMFVAASVGLAAVHGIVASRNPARARPFALLGVAASVGIVVFATALVP